MKSLVYLVVPQRSACILLRLKCSKMAALTPAVVPQSSIVDDDDNDGDAQNVNIVVDMVMADCDKNPALKQRFSVPQFMRPALISHLSTASYSKNADAKTREGALAKLVENFRRLTVDGEKNPDEASSTGVHQREETSQDQVSDKMAQASTLKEKGNTFFVGKDYESAATAYTEAVGILTTPNASADERNLSKAESVMISALYSNLAACCLAQGNHSQAVNHCKACLEYDPKNIKALHRLAKAQMEMGMTSDALATFNRGMALDEGLYAEKSKKRLMSSFRKSRIKLLDSLPEEPIETYSFSDEGKPSVKVYITMPGVGNMPRDDISVEFKRMSMDLRVRGYEGCKTMRMFAAELWSSVDPAKCKIKLKPDMIVLSLRKQNNDGMRPWERLRRG